MKVTITITEDGWIVEVAKNGARVATEQMLVDGGGAKGTTKAAVFEKELAEFPELYEALEDLTFGCLDVVHAMERDG